MAHLTPVTSNNNFSAIESAEINLSLCKEKKISKKLFFETNPYEIISQFNHNKEKCIHLIEEITLITECELTKNNRLEKKYKTYFQKCIQKIQELDILAKSKNTPPSPLSNLAVNSSTIETIKISLSNTKYKYYFIFKNIKKLNEIMNEITARNVVLKKKIKFLQRTCANINTQTAVKIEQILAEEKIADMSSELFIKNIFAGFSLLVVLLDCTSKAFYQSLLLYRDLQPL